ncbi:hypothetical protein J1G42_03385 [Cellulomonas sp. zg-ZUI222]|uniref:hypothetical protein n=1 Tax=Cellulomonas wangleii TaxID=2816956 RepID=UPI001A94DBF3|nr:hypothetical protein [Cellulomonas wangleii]MBO0919867.1 hypothetical protein [Cellulomonas wangleii]
MTREPGTGNRHIPINVLFVLGVVLVVALPLLVGVLVTGFLPDVGTLRAGSGWRVLHLLWIYPTFVVLLFLLVTPVARAFGRATHPASGVVAELGLSWLLLTALLQVYFEQPGGAAIAAAIALAALGPFARLLERTAPDDDTRP